MDKIIKTGLWSVILSVCLQADGGVKNNVKSAKAQVPLATSSAYLNGDSRNEWLQDMKAKLIMTSRVLDPFGLPQVIEKKVEAKVPEEVKRIEKNLDFKNAVQAIGVNAVMPPRKFIIGAREFEVGDSFPIKRQGKVFKVKVISVKSSGVTLQNMDTKEYARKSLAKLPTGWRSGKGIGEIKGVQSTSDGEDTAITVE